MADLRKLSDIAKPSSAKSLPEAHKHKFEPQEEQVKLYETSGVASATDTLKQRVCACGRKETYDLERSHT